jgi:hypothetical protein
MFVNNAHKNGYSKLQRQNTPHFRYLFNIVQREHLPSFEAPDEFAGTGVECDSAVVPPPSVTSTTAAVKNASAAASS